MKKVACVIIFWLTASLLIEGCSRDVTQYGAAKRPMAEMLVPVPIIGWKA